MERDEIEAAIKKYSNWRLVNEDVVSQWILWASYLAWKQNKVPKDLCCFLSV